MAKRQFIFSGEGVNKKTGKEVKFIVPLKISDVGLEKLVKNIKVTKIKEINFDVLRQKFRGMPVSEEGMIRFPEYGRGMDVLIEIKDENGISKPFDPEKINLETASRNEIWTTLLWIYSAIPSDKYRRFWE